MKQASIEKLMEIKNLYEAGILTKEEMETEKQKILNTSVNPNMKVAENNTIQMPNMQPASNIQCDNNPTDTNRDSLCFNKPEATTTTNNNTATATNTNTDIPIRKDNSNLEHQYLKSEIKDINGNAEEQILWILGILFVIVMLIIAVNSCN